MKSNDTYPLIYTILMGFLLIHTTVAADIDRSVIVPKAKDSLLLGIDRKGSLIVAVGERGHVLFTNDAENWQQANVETRLTLTSVFLINEKTGWAVGHDAVILKTEDGALNWKRVFQATEEVPLLDLVFLDPLNGIAVGAYGLMYKTSNGGTSWQKTPVNIINKNILGLENNESFDLHLNSISCVTNNRCYIAAESGYLLRTDDTGYSWTVLKTPYEGSFFGTVCLSRDELLVYGLKGHLYRSVDGGVHWKHIDTYTSEMLTAAIILASGDIVIAGMGGTLLISHDNGVSFSKLDLKHRNALSALIETESGTLAVSGEKGIEVIPIDKILQRQ